MPRQITSRLIKTKNNGFRHEYSFIKNKSFKKFFLNFMEDLGFNKNKTKKTFTSINKNERYVELKISDLKDCVKYYKNKNYDIEVFYGDKKIIMVLKTKKRKKAIEHLVKKGIWGTSIKTKKGN